MSTDDEVYGGDGYSATELFGSKKKSCYAYTYDDVIILPGHINGSYQDISLENHITRNIKVKIPLLSSPMDTVTEHTMAINMALLGAIGVIHSNMPVEEQVEEVRLVKKYKNGFIANPACLSPDHMICDVDKLKEQFGYSGIPITIDGKMGTKLVGIVCYRDIDYIEDRSTKLKDVMTTNVFTGKPLLYIFHHILALSPGNIRSSFPTAPEGVSLAEANELMRRSKKGKLPVVNTAGEIVSLISRSGKNRFLLYHEAYSGGVAHPPILMVTLLQISRRVASSPTPQRMPTSSYWWPRPSAPAPTTS